MGLQWHQGLQWGLRSLLIWWTSACQNVVKSKKYWIRKVRLGSTKLRIYKFLLNIYEYLNKNVTFIPFQSRTILVLHMRSSTSSFAWKLDGKDFEGYLLQSRYLKSLGRCFGPCGRWTPWIISNLRLANFEKASRFQCAFTDFYSSPNSRILGSTRTMPWTASAS